MRLSNQDEPDHHITDGYASDEAFSTVSDDLESYAPAGDSFLKYSKLEDPPVLIACVACLSHGT
jgi:hypothetical protein